MRKETYKIPCPKHIVFGDPLYFEQFKGRKLQSLVVDYQPPEHFEARLVLQERESKEVEGFMERNMELFLAPAKAMETYLDGMMYNSQKAKEKAIGVDTASYLLSIDDRSDEIHTGSDGYWGSTIELYRNVGGKRISDAMLISVICPDDTDFDGMRKMASYFSPDMQQVDKAEKKKKRGDTAR